MAQSLSSIPSTPSPQTPPSNLICIEPTLHIDEFPTIQRLAEQKEAPSWIPLCSKGALTAKINAIKERFFDHPYLFTPQNVAKRQALRPKLAAKIAKQNRALKNLEKQQTLFNMLMPYDEAMETLEDQTAVRLISNNLIT